MGFINREKNTAEILIDNTNSINFNPLEIDYETALKVMTLLSKAENILS